MGIDLVAGGRSKRTKRTAPRSDDVYLKLLVKLYKSLVREDREQLQRGDTEAALHEPDQSAADLSQEAHRVRPGIGPEDSIAVIVGTVTDVKRAYDVSAVRFTDTASRRGRGSWRPAESA